ncbi:SpoIIE family protein phosphatase [Streptomyces sp. RB6PN25]|uniref:SpoIIE family protein phosphatase n=1 Tax=Streptomyces humicola TaxID=2953240 RepID=A0ABT1PSA0_9ACTN|nr:SpoIIE family protein phosphatase [Streptomyces humicola]MCQ4079432.1 SpoIIE family protein phosphatase [Streptomyces humicola]
MEFPTGRRGAQARPEGSGQEDEALMDSAAAALSTGGAEELLRGMVHGTAAAVVMLDPQLRYRYVNPSFVRMTGVPAGEVVGRTLAETLPGINRNADVLRQVLADGQPREAVSSGLGRLDSPQAPHERRWWRGTYHRLEVGGRVTGIIGIVFEVTEAVQQWRDLERTRARLALLDEVATRIGTSLDVETTCAQLADFVISTVAKLADMAAVEVVPSHVAQGGGTTRTGTVRLHRTAVACVPALRSRVADMTSEYARYPDGAPVQRCLQTGQPVVLNRLSEGELTHYPSGTRRAAAYRAAGIHSVLVVPLTARGHTIGTVTLARTGESPPFTDKDVVLTQDVAGRAAISIDNARRYARSQDIALELQRALLTEPGSPHPNVELACRYLPSGTSAVVGGDWFETIRLPYGRTLLAIGDVMGHGIEAAVDMSNYRSVLRYVAATDLPPHRILRQLDTMICEESEYARRPATCLLALADPARARWTYSSAGHLPPAIFSPDSDTELIDVPTGPPLGTGFGGYELVIGDLQPGQVLLLYTDGLVERRDEDIDQSLARLAKLRLPLVGDLDDLIDQVLRTLVPHAVEDDIAILAARVRPRPVAGESAPHS